MLCLVFADGAARLGVEGRQASLVAQALLLLEVFLLAEAAVGVTFVDELLDMDLVDAKTFRLEAFQSVLRFRSEFRGTTHLSVRAVWPATIRPFAPF